MNKELKTNFTLDEYLLPIVQFFNGHCQSLAVLAAMFRYADLKTIYENCRMRIYIPPSLKPEKETQDFCTVTNSLKICIEQLGAFRRGCKELFSLFGILKSGGTMETIDKI